MFDWLFGDGGKAKEEQRNKLRESQYDQTYGREISSGMNDIMADPANAELIAQAGADFSNNWNNQANSIRSGVNRNQLNVDDMQKQYDQLEKSSKHDYFGNGLLGAILNPIGQTATAGFDLATGQYANNDRDVMSDLGAAGQTALSFLPFAGGLARAGGAIGKVGGAVGKAVNSVPGMALTGAGFNAGETLRQGGSDTQLGDMLSAGATGAAFGAGIPIAGRMGGKFLRNRGAKQVAEKFMTDPRNAKASAQLQEAGGGAVNSLIRDIAGRERNNLAQRYGGLYQNALSSMVPRSTAGKLALGGGAIYGGSRLLGMGAEQDPTQQLAAEFVQMYGREPSEYELQLLTAGGY